MPALFVECGWLAAFIFMAIIHQHCRYVMKCLLELLNEGVFVENILRYCGTKCTDLNEGSSVAHMVKYIF